MTTISRTAPVTRTLLADGRLAIEYDPAVEEWVDRWLPRLPFEEPQPDLVEAMIRIERRPATVLEAPGSEALLTLGSVTAWLGPEESEAIFMGRSPGATGRVDLIGLEARLQVTGTDPVEGADLYSMLTLSAALLLGRMGRTPVHAAAVLAPNQEAIILAGDARAGKSTTTVNLITAGWDYLSDDQIVISRAGDQIEIEGWPRPFHLDEGWDEGRSTGQRRTIDVSRLGPGEWRRRAPLGGLLFPVVRADEPTHLEPISAAYAFAGVVRQAPWLVVDRGSSTELLGLLSDLAHLRAFRLVLGLDSYNDPSRLVAALAVGWPELA